jgi:methylglutaconyl-CoA hydratase
MSDLVLTQSLRAGVTAVTLNRADRRNALSIELLDHLCAAVQALEADAAQRVVILRGAGPAFSAGLDLHEAAEAALVERSAAAVERALTLLQETPLIVIAAVQGGAFAGGAGVMAACDLVIAADNAKFGFPEARRGLLPALILPVLQRKVRAGDLADLLLAGEIFTAERGRQVGLVQRVVPAAEVLSAAQSVANSLLAGGPETIRLTKQLLRGGPHDQVLIAAHLAARRSDEAREGLAAFAEKRPPWWALPADG